MGPQALSLPCNARLPYLVIEVLPGWGGCLLQALPSYLPRKAACSVFERGAQCVRHARLGARRREAALLFKKNLFKDMIKELLKEKPDLLKPAWILALRRFQKPK